MEIALSAKTTTPQLFAAKCEIQENLSIEHKSYGSLLSNDTEKLSFTLDMAKIAYGKTIHLFDLEKSCDANFDLTPKNKLTRPTTDDQGIPCCEKDTSSSEGKIYFGADTKNENSSTQTADKTKSVVPTETPEECLSTQNKKAPGGVSTTQYRGILKKYIQ